MCHVLIEIRGNKTGVFFQLIDNVCFVHNIQLPKPRSSWRGKIDTKKYAMLPVGNDVFEVVGQHFASDFDALNKFGHLLSLDVRDQVGVTVTTVNHQAAEF